jgi:outer membrane lipopolysaccharide assembly protein LptE/RlpB
MRAMLLVVAVLAACGWHADASAQAKVPRVGVFSQGAGAQPFFKPLSDTLPNAGGRTART